MSDELILLVTLLDSDVFGYSAFKVVIRTTTSEMPNYENFREADVEEKYAELLDDIHYTAILKVEVVQDIV